MIQQAPIVIIDNLEIPGPDCAFDVPAATVVAAVPIVALGMGPDTPFCASTVLESCANPTEGGL